MTDHDDVTPDNLPGTGKPWEPDAEHTEPDADPTGTHLHAWVLGHDDGRPFYVAMPRPFKSRGNATYHAKKWAEPIHGSFGFMVLECKGDNAACPLWCTFRASGAQALLEPWHNTDGKEGENG